MIKVLRTKIPTQEKPEDIQKVIAMGDPRTTAVTAFRQQPVQIGTEGQRTTERLSSEENIDYFM